MLIFKNNDSPGLLLLLGKQSIKFWCAVSRGLQRLVRFYTAVVSGIHYLRYSTSRSSTPPSVKNSPKNMPTLRPLLLCALAVALCSVMSTTAAQTPSNASGIIERIRLFETEASKRPSYEIADEIERQRTVIAIKQRSGQSLFAMDDGTIKTTGYVQALKQRRDAKEPAGSFYYSAYNLRICGGLQLANATDLGDTVKQCLLESLNGFKVASDAGRGDASFSVGRMYERGWGVIASRLVAAEWFLKAANQHNLAGARDDALTAVEAALAAVPDHPPAIKLRASMLK